MITDADWEVFAHYGRTMLTVQAFEFTLFQIVQLHGVNRKLDAVADDLLLEKGLDPNDPGNSQEEIDELLRDFRGAKRPE